MTLRLTPLLFPMLAVAAGCSIGQGTGQVKSDIVCGANGCSGGLFVHDCWGTPPTAADPTTAQGAPYDLGSDLFFAANPYRNNLQIRVQRGTDLTEVSDGLSVLIDDVNPIRAAIQAAASGGSPASDAGASDAGAGGGSGTLVPVSVGTPCNAGATGPSATFQVGLPAGIHPPGSPILPPPYAPVHMSLYLQRTCHIQNSVLYAVDGTVTFRALFDGNPNETSAADKLIDADFDVHIGDLTDVAPGDYANDIPPGLQSRVTGCFRFYYQRGQPAQPFP